MAPERKSKAGFLLPEIHGRCTQPIRRKGPLGWVTEVCGKRNVKELPDGTQVCAGCFNKDHRHAEAQAAADAKQATLQSQVTRLRARFGVEAAVQAGQPKNGVPMPTGKIVVDPTQLLSVLTRLEHGSVPQPRRTRAKVSA
jgi:hypothetical protein